MTVWFWDPSFHTEDNCGTHLQPLQKIQTLTHAPEGIKSRLNLSSGKHVTMFLLDILAFNTLARSA